MKLKQSTRR